MSTKTVLREVLEREENSTVSDSFGGPKIDGRTPSFSVSRIVGVIQSSVSDFPADEISNLIRSLAAHFDDAQLRYVLAAAVRFSFLIELTNLSITSTKMKTRWLNGLITKTQPGTFTNYRGDFAPGSDPRAASYDACYDILVRVLSLLAGSPQHIPVVKNLAVGARRSVSYEFVFTYRDPHETPVHNANNVRLVVLDNISWLVGARPVIRAQLNTATSNKIKTKAYLTDRSQTGTDQTNRAKRWEILSSDFQHATLEQCWSVERKLLSDLVHFQNYPAESRKDLVSRGIFDETAGITRCPITLLPLDFNEFMEGPTHGESRFQVGHLVPLKTGGDHQRDNVAWISNDGNRIQGNLELEAVRTLLIGIVERMRALDTD